MKRKKEEISAKNTKGGGTILLHPWSAPSGSRMARKGREARSSSPDSHAVLKKEKYDITVRRKGDLRKKKVFPFSRSCKEENLPGRPSKKRIEKALFRCQFTRSGWKGHFPGHEGRERGLLEKERWLTPLTFKSSIL